MRVSDDFGVGVLLEREHELGVLGDAVLAAVSGEGRAVAVEGPAGIGKTALLEAALDGTGLGGVRVLRAAGGELEADLPFGVVRQLFEQALGALTRERREAMLRGVAGLAWPGFAAMRSPAAPTGDAGSVLHGLYWFVAELCAEAPLVVAVDDLQWADSASLRFVLYLIRRLDGLSASMLLSVRAGERTGTQASLLAQVLAHPGVVRVELPPLSETAVGQIVASRLGRPTDERFAVACRRATGGVPFLVHALIAELAAGGIDPNPESVRRIGEIGPQTVGQATLLRLAGIHPHAAELARAVAVLGVDGNLPRAAQLAHVEAVEAWGALDALVAGGVLARGEVLGFAHPILRTSVYSQIPPGERSLLHLRAADQLTQEGCADEAVARHLVATEPCGRLDVIDRLRSAAASARACGAPENAPIYLRRALAEGPPRPLRAELLLELGLAEKAIRDPACAGHLEEALGLLQDPNARAAAALELSDVRTFAGQWDAALEALEVGIGEGEAVDPTLALRLQTARLNAALFDTAMAGAVDRWLPALRAAVDGGRAPRVTLLEVALCDVLRGERLPAAIGLVERGLDEGRLLAEEGAESWALTRALLVLSFADELDLLEQLLDAMAADARRRGSVFGFVVTSGFRVCLHGRRGELAACEDELRRTLVLAQEHDLPLPVVFTLRYATEALVERPELSDLAQKAMEIELAPVHQRTLTGAWLAELRARLLLASGERARAASELHTCAPVVSALRMQPAVCAWRSTLALASADPVEARALAEAELAHARRVGTPRAIGVALRVLGLLDGGATGVDRMREAEAILAGSSARLEHARALVDLGAALRRAGQRADAREPLRAGLDLALRCGATRLCDHARVELAATGARPRREMISGRDALTPTEQRIARMAADGMPNREIAQALFVTTKTIENQLGRVYKKLGVAGRKDLPGALAN